jgi:hypothetical protein
VLVEVYVERYLNAAVPENTVGLYRPGTRVLFAISSLDDFTGEPWSTGYLQGMIDPPCLQLTPGTQDGIVRDGSYETMREALQPLEETLSQIMRQEQEAEEEAASRTILRAVQRAFARPCSPFHTRIIRGSRFWATRAKRNGRATSSAATGRQLRKGR